jgi:uncharacterized membrane protein
VSTEKGLYLLIGLYCFFWLVTAYILPHGYLAPFIAAFLAAIVGLVISLIVERRKKA